MRMDINNKSQITTDLLSSSALPFAALGTTKFPHNNITNNNTNNSIRRRVSTNGHPYPTKNKTFIIHRTFDGRRFLSEQSSSTRPHCTLCHNKHPNPWHDTSNCPLKHPTHIIDTTIHEHVMQYNALHPSTQANSAVTTTDHPIIFMKSLMLISLKSRLFLKRIWLLHLLLIFKKTLP
jgi:hypothetical protein